MSNNKTILIVDDEFIILESLRIQISRILPDDVLLEAASSGEEAIQLIDDFENENKNLLLVFSDFQIKALALRLSFGLLLPQEEVGVA